ncbi:hypothetical protein HGM15179_014433, partial [Zosterops borbonicus]
MTLKTPKNQRDAATSGTMLSWHLTPRTKLYEENLYQRVSCKMMFSRKGLDFTCLPAGTPDKPVSLGNERGELRKGQDTQAPSSCITPEQESEVINSLCHFSQFKKSPSTEMLSIACSNTAAQSELLLTVSGISSSENLFFQYYPEVLG